MIVIMLKIHITCCFSIAGLLLNWVINIQTNCIQLVCILHFCLAYMHLSYLCGKHIQKNVKISEIPSMEMGHKLPIINICNNNSIRTATSI